MICLIAGAKIFADKWAKSQNLRADEWFFANDIFTIYKHKHFHTILVHEGIDLLTNDQLNVLLTTAWEAGKRK